MVLLILRHLCVAVFGEPGFFSRIKLKTRPPFPHLGEREIPGGQAASLAGCPSGRKAGYQRRKLFSHSSSSTRVRICSSKCAPRGPQPICCFFTIRLLTT